MGSIKSTKKTYEAVFVPGKHKGVYGISLVENPAMQGRFIALSEHGLRLGQVKDIDDTIAIQYEGEKMAVGGRVWILADDGTEVALPVGEYVLQENKKLVVSEEGRIGAVKETTPKDRIALTLREAKSNGKK